MLVVVLVVAGLAGAEPARGGRLGLVLGGALGNLADRAFRGHHGDVVDFITLTHWPTFNVADACITVGASSCSSSSTGGPPADRHAGPTG